MNATELIGLNIQNLRQSRRWSQERLAAEAGIDRSYVSLIEHGQSSPTAKKLEQIAKALGVSVKELHNERGVNVPTSHEQRLKGEPVAKLICPKTGVKMGDFYVWDNGEHQLSIHPEFEERFFPKKGM